MEANKCVREKHHFRKESEELAQDLIGRNVFLNDDGTSVLEICETHGFRGDRYPNEPGRVYLHSAFGGYVTTVTCGLDDSVGEVVALRSGLEVSNAKGRRLIDGPHKLSDYLGVDDDLDGESAFLEEGSNQYNFWIEGDSLEYSLIDRGTVCEDDPDELVAKFYKSI